MPGGTRRISSPEASQRPQPSARGISSAVPPNFPGAKTAPKHQKERRTQMHTLTKRNRASLRRLGKITRFMSEARVPSPWPDLGSSLRVGCYLSHLRRRVTEDSCNDISCKRHVPSLRFTCGPSHPSMDMTQKPSSRRDK